jgi:hypothetical protein
MQHPKLGHLFFGLLLLAGAVCAPLAGPDAAPASPHQPPQRLHGQAGVTEAAFPLSRFLSPPRRLAALPLSGAAMEDLQSVIVNWLSVRFGLPADHHHPRVELLPAEQISELRYGNSGLTSHRDVVAVYDDSSETIYLNQAWRGRTVADLSVLVHEMVHHLQNLGGASFACPAAREELAYHAQAQWLAAFGADLFQEFELDPITLKLSTACLPY